MNFQIFGFTFREWNCDVCFMHTEYVAKVLGTKEAADKIIEGFKGTLITLLTEHNLHKKIFLFS